MKTPICDFVNSYANDDPVRAHMPGHKGMGDEVCRLDITEISGADSLYDACGIIKESETLAGELFGADTFFSAEGSSLCIRAMLYLACIYARDQKKEPLVLAGRNSHSSFVSTAALLGFGVEWLWGDKDKSYLSCNITTQQLEEAIVRSRPAAVYITSPDYLGNIQDISLISRICKKHKTLLLVDNAHGAYLRFLPHGLHPIELGADMCCDSAHKTLPVLTGGAYLHISPQAPTFFKENAKRAMGLFGSTSPSYIILQSLDKANSVLPQYKKRIAEFLPKLCRLRTQLSELGYTLTGDEPLKLTLRSKEFGYTGHELSELLKQSGVICEYSDPDHTVLMLTPENEKDLHKLFDAFSGIKRRPKITAAPPELSPPLRIMEPRQALLSPCEAIAVSDCIGRIAADASVSCPPAVSVLVGGERIGPDALRCMEYYGIKEIRVIKE